MYLFLIADNHLNTRPFVRSHIRLLCAYMVCYLTLNVAVSFSHKPIYKPIDWVSLQSYIYAVTAVLLGVGHFSLVSALNSRLILRRQRRNATHQELQQVE